MSKLLILNLIGTTLQKSALKVCRISQRKTFVQPFATTEYFMKKHVCGGILEI